MVPTVADPPATPFTDHVTPVFALPVTVAENACVLPSASVVDAGFTAMAIGFNRVTDAWPMVPGLAAEFARIVTTFDAGSAAGAVYTPAAVMVPLTASPPA